MPSTKAVQDFFLSTFKKPIARKILLSLIFCFALSWVVLYEIQFPHDFRAGDVVPFDVIAPFSFEIVDNVSTEEKRQKAESSILMVYDFDSTVFSRMTGQIYRAFRDMRTQARQIPWSRSPQQLEVQVRDFFVHKQQFEKDLGVPVSDSMFEWLVNQKFNPRIESAIIRNLEFWYQRKIAETPERFIPPQQKEITARVVDRSGSPATNNREEEFTISKLEILDLQNEKFFILEDRRGLERFSPQDKENTLALARALIVPNLTLNKHETALRKSSARSAILPSMITVKKNQTIVGKGKTVQNSNLALMEQIDKVQNERNRLLMTVSLTLLLFLILVTFASYVRRFTQNRIKFQIKDLFVMCLISIISVLTVKCFQFLTDAVLVRLSDRLSSNELIYAAPLALGPMLVGLLIPAGEIVWLFTAFLALSFGIMEDFDFALSLVALVGGISAARGVSQCTKRNDIYRAGIRTGLVTFGVLFYLNILSENSIQGSYDQILWKAGAGLLGGILSSLLTMICIPLFETVFRYTTDIKLLELSNMNHPLLKEMLVKAPGTYHHSIMVGTLVESAAEEIGANPLLGKVMGYYHDIGKMVHPQYFIENQRPGLNPHEHISPYMSRTLLIAHVKDGAELARQHKLGQPIVDGIVQHHGTTLISYFYNKAMKIQKPDDSPVSEEDFRYPGPKPQFKESGVLMIADSVEAASRTLEDPSPARIQNLIKSMIQKKFNDGQLDECNLSLRDLYQIEKTFVRILIGVYHHRVEYPSEIRNGDQKLHNLSHLKQHIRGKK